MIMSRAYTTLWWILLAALAISAAVPFVPWQSLRVSSEPEIMPVLIIDAGHGGADGGATAADGTLESDLNLDIALILKALCAFYGVETVMTREAAEIDYPEGANTISSMKKADQNARLLLINSIPSAVLISIHQNNYPAASPWGIQVFYNDVPGSGGFAELLQANLTTQLCPDNRRVAEKADDGIYLMRRAEHPAALVECGFLSNPGDLQKLESEAYRTKLALVMLSSYLQYTVGAMV